MALARELVTRAHGRKTFSETDLGATHTFVATYRADTKQAPRILFIHGIRGTHEGLEAIVGALPGIECIVPDLPAFGRTAPLAGTHDVAALQSWLSELVNLYKPDAIVAHSYGTLLVSGAPSAASIPQILINPIVELRMNRAKRASSRLTNVFYALCLSLGENWGRRLCSARLLVDAMSFGLASKAGADVRSWVFAQHRQHFSSFASLRTLSEHSKLATSMSLGIKRESRTPLLLIAGSRDVICDAEQIKQYAEQVEEASVELLEGFGHLIHYEAPELAAAAIKRFVSES
jgi:pimeloyl-ACP methyl ester carboxylesterase